ncbi:EAL domain-containing protein [Rhodoferax sp. WC2427]|uniref:bifunctional diguanylate cyclase/phosphodiesterase n=1 Tax=Rhodoferax sp. WC2427 TaxID=3234144 RepID=UPI003465965A
MSLRLFQRLNMGSWRLSTRIVVLSLVLLMLLQMAVLLLVHASIERNARRQVASDLVGAERVWSSLVEQKIQRLTQGAEVLATDSGFKETVTSLDEATIRSALENYGERTGSAVTALVNNSLSPIAINAGTTGIQADFLQQIATPLQSGKQAGQLAVVQGHPYLFVMVPLKAPLQIGWILMGFATDKTLSENLYKLSNISLALAVSTDGGKTSTIPISNLPADALADLQRAGLSSREFSSHADTLLIRHLAPKTIGGTVDVLLVRSLNQATAPFQDLQMILLGITVLGLLLFGLGSAWTARRVTTPLRSLVYNAERLGLGEYDQPIKHTERRDEIGDLANAFDRMRKNISLKQTEIQQLAYWDRLTRLPNRVRFRDAVKEAIASNQAVGSRVQMPLSVITLNLDRFKHVNDILGYALGDRLLVAVAERLLARMDEGALVARLGGDEFSVLLPHADAETAIQVAQRIATAFEAPLSFDDQTVDLSASLGIVCWPQHAADVDTLLGRAEVAMYVAKRKTTVLQLYDPALDSTSKQTLSLLSELRHAVEHNELRLFLQPKIELSTGNVIAAEALVRWQHPVRGLVPPDSFIPFAEQTGFVRQLTLWMFDEAARQWAALQLADQPLRISVNLSTRDLLDPDFPARLDVLLAKHSVAPEGFCLEITESAIMDDPLRAEGTLKRLSERGFRLSIDDFGTGYSSLAYLKRLPVDELKIDKSFVMGMERDPDDAKIVRSTIDLAHNMGLSVVAEGVENIEIWHLLREQHCDEAQGYYMSKPLPVDAFKTWRARWAERADV